MRDRVGCAAWPIEQLPGTGPAVALTFDDGPDPEFTPCILALLETHGVTATFFVLGAQGSCNADLIKALRDAGMGIGVHSWEHLELRGRDPRLVRDELGRTIDLLHRLEVSPVLFRPPFGSWDEGLLAAAARRGLWTVGWTVDALDWQETEQDRLVARVKASLDPGSIVLMHDGGGDRSATVAALPRIIELASAAGLEVVDLAGALSGEPGG